MNWGCLWAHSTFIPEWFNGELLSLFNGTQHVAKQIAENHMVKVAVREEAVDLISTKYFPPKVISLFQELLRLPISDMPYFDGLLVNDSKVKLLNKGKTRLVTLEEEIALRTLFSSKIDYLEFESVKLDSARFFDRFIKTRTRSTFTTSSYTRSPKRIN